MMAAEFKSRWEHTSLRNLCSRISSGGTPSRQQPQYFVFDGNLWVKSKELLDGSIYDTEEKITDEAVAKSSAKFYPENTVLLAMYGANVGQLAILRRRATVNQAICGLVVEENTADYRYVFYALLQTRTDLTVQAFGAAQQNLNQETIRGFGIPTPPLPIQRKIAAVLSAYDDLIENNTRRVQILEEMVQALYREWFIHFRFPGHEHGKMVDSALGPIPEGWSVGSLSGIADLAKQTVVPWKHPHETFAHHSFPAFDRNQMPALELGIDIKSNKNLITKDSILLSKMNPHIPRVWLTATNPHRSIASTEFLVLEPKTEADRGTLYCLSCSDEFQRQYRGLSVGTSTSHQRIKPSDFMSLPVVLPTASCRTEFEKHAAPILQQCQNLRSRNATLRQTRDSLLPKLISGEVAVDDLDIETGKTDSTEAEGASRAPSA